MFDLALPRGLCIFFLVATVVFDIALPRGLCIFLLVTLRLCLILLYRVVFEAACIVAAHRVELEHIMSILPSWRVNLGAEYADKLVASDASLFGLGVCTSSPGVDKVLAIGRVA